MSDRTPVSELDLEGAGQLRLALFLDEPWDGRSPRALTRGYVGLIFKAQADKSVSGLVDPRQIEIWPTKKNGPPHVWGGSPSLLPLVGGS